MPLLVASRTPCLPVPEMKTSLIKSGFETFVLNLKDFFGLLWALLLLLSGLAFMRMRAGLQRRELQTIATSRERPSQD
jgi:hypothetical protein